MGLEDIARMQVGRKLPNGFKMERRQFVNRVLAEIVKSNEWGLQEDESEYRDCLQLRPDGFAINPSLRHVLCIEIEDTHPLTREKLQKYTEAWWMCDYEEWLLRLCTTDRYGHGITEHNLCNYWYDFNLIERCGANA